MYKGQIEDFSKKIKIIDDPNDLYKIRSPNVHCVMLRRERNPVIDDFIDSIKLGQGEDQIFYITAEDDFVQRYNERFSNYREEKGRKALLDELLFTNRIFSEATGVLPVQYDLSKARNSYIFPHTDQVKFTGLVSYGNGVEEGTLFFHPSTYDRKNKPPGARMEVSDIENRIAAAPHWIAILSGYAVHSWSIGVRTVYSLDG